MGAKLLHSIVCLHRPEQVGSEGARPQVSGVRAGQLIAGVVNCQPQPDASQGSWKAAIPSYIWEVPIEGSCWKYVRQGPLHRSNYTSLPVCSLGNGVAVNANETATTAVT